MTQPAPRHQVASPFEPGRGTTAPRAMEDSVSTHIPEKKTEVTYHPYAECADQDCSFETPPSMNARDAAKNHVRATGHKVRVVTEKVALWGPK